LSGTAERDTENVRQVPSKPQSLYLAVVLIGIIVLIAGLAVLVA
jgi:hypothetical protein